jgi:hypothetical protein
MDTPFSHRALVRAVSAFWNVSAFSSPNDSHLSAFLVLSCLLPGDWVFTCFMPRDITRMDSSWSTKQELYVSGFWVEQICLLEITNLGVWGS